MNWDAVAAVAQGVEALVVLVGGIAIFYQLRQFRTEQTHSKWEALRWALSVVTLDDINLILDTVLDVIDWEPNRFGKAFNQLMTGLSLVSAAIDDGYLEHDLFFQTRARDLSKLGVNKLRTHPDLREKVLKKIETRIMEPQSPAASPSLCGAY
jgi:hypothetical protein